MNILYRPINLFILSIFRFYLTPKFHWWWASRLVFNEMLEKSCMDWRKFGFNMLHMSSSTGRGRKNCLNVFVYKVRLSPVKNNGEIHFKVTNYIAVFHLVDTAEVKSNIYKLPSTQNKRLIQTQPHKSSQALYKQHSEQFSPSWPLVLSGFLNIVSHRCHWFIRPCRSTSCTRGVPLEPKIL